MTDWHTPTPPTVNEHGDETHPAYGSISVHNVTSNPGAVLFDSDLKHSHFVEITVGRMTRKRDLNRDWLHPTGEMLTLHLSEAQWAAFVSARNTSAVPCTIRRTESEVNVPGLEFAPRLAESIAETHAAADRVFGRIKAARDAYEAVLNDKTKGAKDRREALRDLHFAIENATGNVDFAAQSLVEHAENVVTKARADVEAMVASKAEALGVDVGDVRLALGSAESDEPTPEAAW